MSRTPTAERSSGDENVAKGLLPAAERPSGEVHEADVISRFVVRSSTGADETLSMHQGPLPHIGPLWHSLRCTMNYA